MAARRKKPATRSGARKRGSSGIPAWFWLLGGILIGLGAALALMMKGYLPEIKQHLPSMDDTSVKPAEPAIVEDDKSEEKKPKKPRYDFFTVLPEMEVVVPEQELSQHRQSASPAAAGTGESTDAESYLLQVGSFMSAAEADQMKAQLALSGFAATVQSVTVNDATWHRVRVGPVQGMQQADEYRRRLQANGIDSLVMKIP